MKSKIFCIFLISIFNINFLISQTYCLTINTVDNGATVTFNWSISASQTAAASIEVFGTGVLSSNGSQIIGGFSSTSFSGNFTWTKSMSGVYGYTTDDSAPFGVVLSAPPNTRFTQFCAVAPITLSTFSATKHSDRSSRLSWTTASEINSEYFGIERSSDGDTWETLNKVPAAGNSNEDLAYEFIDDRLPFTRSKDEIFYYRLRLTDLDGTYKYSDIKGVNFNRLQNDIISIYPNPTTDRINVDVSAIDATEGDIQLSVFDNMGRNMLQKSIIGTGIELIETVNYPSGTYNIVVKQGETIHQKRVIKLD